MAKRKPGCISLLGFVYWCIRHDSEWPSGWDQCRRRSRMVGDDG